LCVKLQYAMQYKLYKMIFWNELNWCFIYGLLNNNKYIYYISTKYIVGHHSGVDSTMNDNEDQQLVSFVNENTACVSRTKSNVKQLKVKGFLLANCESLLTQVCKEWLVIIDTI